MNRFRAPIAFLIAAILGASVATMGVAASGQPAQATPAPTISSDELFSVTFPADVLPTGEVIVDFFRATFKPGASVTWPRQSAPKGVGVDYVVSGSYTVTTPGPIFILRAADANTGRGPDPVAPSRKVVAGPGDTLIYWNYDGPATFENAGSEPVELISVNVISTAVPEVAPPAQVGIRIEQLPQLTFDEQVAPPDGPLTLELHRMSLASGGAMLPSPERTPALRAVEAGRLTWTMLEPGGTPSPLGALHFIAGQAIPYTPLHPGWSVEFSNTEEDPCVWLELTIS